MIDNINLFIYIMTRALQDLAFSEYLLFLCFTENDYDISVYNYIFNYLLRNILIYFQNIWLFLYLGQSRWENKIIEGFVSTILADLNYVI